MKIKIEENAFIPTRAHKTDAGLDLYSTEDFVIPANGSHSTDIGVHIELPPHTVGMLKSKSGLNVKHGVTSEGVIDEGYTGSIVAKLYNHSSIDYQVKRGDKITQLVILPCIYEEVETVSGLEKNTERGNAGFGSTGK